ncbi:MAG: hypothetical protein H0V81_14280 [Solirubrobacterales bacterium]|nr:hypothetical protein [Solirubrobacterales bacterium]
MSISTTSRTHAVLDSLLGPRSTVGLDPAAVQLEGYFAGIRTAFSAKRLLLDLEGAGCAQTALPLP